MDNTNANKNSGQSEHRLPAEFLVPRNEGFKVHVALVRAAVGNEDLLGEKPFLEALKRAVSGWVAGTREGRDAWNQACEELNVGDLGNECGRESEVHRYLAEQGIFDLDITIAGSGCRDWKFDTVLSGAPPSDDEEEDSLIEPPEKLPIEFKLNDRNETDVCGGCRKPFQLETGFTAFVRRTSDPVCRACSNSTERPDDFQELAKFIDHWYRNFGNRYRYWQFADGHFAGAGDEDDRFLYPEHYIRSLYDRNL